MAPNSSDVNAGDDALATDYNSLRADVLDPATGHKHTGKPGEGAAVPGSLLTDQDAMKGDGSDGSLTLSTLLELSFLKQFTDLTINSGGEIRPSVGVNGVVILVQGALIINSGGKIQAKGFGGAGGVASNPGEDGFVSENPFLETGLGGAREASGKPGKNQIIALTDAGENLFIAFGAGGGSSGSAGPGGDIWAGGGGGSGPNQNSRGGAGGGYIIIFAESITVNAGGEIDADGIEGLVSSSPSGGGGGGLIYIASRSLTETGTIRANGGVGHDGGLGRSGDGANGVVARKIIPG